MFATETHNLSWISRTHKVSGKNQFPQLSRDFHMCVLCETQQKRKRDILKVHTGGAGEMVIKPLGMQKQSPHYEPGTRPASAIPTSGGQDRRDPGAGQPQSLLLELPLRRTWYLPPLPSNWPRTGKTSALHFRSPLLMHTGNTVTTQICKDLKISFSNGLGCGHVSQINPFVPSLLLVLGLHGSGNDPDQGRWTLFSPSS